MVQISKNDADKITTIYKKISQSVGSSPTLSSFTCLGGIYIWPGPGLLIISTTISFLFNFLLHHEIYNLVILVVSSSI